MKKYLDTELGGSGGGPPKPFFTKYRPVEGEIKEGDWYLLPKTNKAVTYLGGGVWPGGKKCKLFLCSRDIKKGEKYWYIGLEGELDEIIAPAPISDCEHAFKVIGEVSPEATFVEENQEFNEDELEFYWHNCIVEGKHITKNEWKEHGKGLSKTPENVLVKIKCKCCNKFC